MGCGEPGGITWADGVTAGYDRRDAMVTRPTRRPGFKPTAPPPAPREVRRRLGTLIGLWVIRLFILPHTLVGIGLLVAMLFLPFWQLCGSNSLAPATRVWST